MNLKSFFTTAILLSFFYIPSIAQVTIGVDEAPIDGAILQLKDNKPSTNGANATGGLGLPKVLLHDFSELKIGENGETNITNEKEKKAHTGLLVYNVDNKYGMCKGLFVWNGEIWEELGVPEETSSYNPNTGILKDTEGNEYYTGDFGDAGIWTTENIRVETVYIEQGKRMCLSPSFNNGEIARPHLAITEVQEEEYMKHMTHYNWAAATAMRGGSDGKGINIDESLILQEIKGICPKGWHLPTAREWVRLVNAIGKEPERYSSSTIENFTPLNELVKPNSWVAKGVGHAMRTSSKLIGGISIKGTSKDAKDNGFDNVSSSPQYAGGLYFWSSSADGALHARYVDNTLREGGANGEVGFNGKPHGKRQSFFKVRCKKDE